MIMSEEKKKKKPVNTTGNKGGRPPTARKRAEQEDALKEIFVQADGDPILLMQLMLKNGHRLHLDVQTTLRMARELAPYEKPKLSSIEQRNIDTSPPTIIFQVSDEQALGVEDVRRIKQIPEGIIITEEDGSGAS